MVKKCLYLINASYVINALLKSDIFDRLTGSVTICSFLKVILSLHYDGALKGKQGKDLFLKNKENKFDVKTSETKPWFRVTYLSLHQSKLQGRVVRSWVKITQGYCEI